MKTIVTIMALVMSSAAMADGPMLPTRFVYDEDIKRQTGEFYTCMLTTAEKVSAEHATVAVEEIVNAVETKCGASGLDLRFIYAEGRAGGIIGASDAGKASGAEYRAAVRKDVAAQLSAKRLGL